MILTTARTCSTKPVHPYFTAYGKLDRPFVICPAYEGGHNQHLPSENFSVVRVRIDTLTSDTLSTLCVSVV